MPRRTKKTSLPLPPRFFVSPPLDQKTIQRIDEHSERAFRRLVELTDVTSYQANEIEWSLSSASHALQVYTGKIRRKHQAGIVNVMATTQVIATIDEVEKLFAMDSHTSYEAFRTAFEPDILDSATLYNLTKELSSRTRHVAVRWNAVRSHSKLIKARDMCLVERHEEFTQGSRRCWARSVTSLDFPKVCPDLQASIDHVRMHVYVGGYVFRETNVPGRLSLTALFQVNGMGSLPSWIVRNALKRRMNQLVHWNRYFGKRERSSVYTDKTGCSMCQKIFGSSNSKLSCQMCNILMCKSCYRGHRVGMNDMMVCVGCAAQSMCQKTPPHVSGESKCRPNSPAPYEEDDAFFVPATTRSLLSAVPSSCMLETTSHRKSDYATKVEYCPPRRFSLQLTQSQKSMSPFSNTTRSTDYPMMDELEETVDIADDDELMSVDEIQYRDLRKWQQERKDHDFEIESDDSSTIAIVC